MWIFHAPTKAEALAIAKRLRANGNSAKVTKGAYGTWTITSGGKLKRNPSSPNPPLGRWLRVQNSRVKKIRFRRGGRIDVIMTKPSASRKGK